MNLFTEEQARTKVCPFLGEPCRGSACMMWRERFEREDLTDEEMRRAGTAIGVAAALKPQKFPVRGQCGLPAIPHHWNHS